MSKDSAPPKKALGQHWLSDPTALEAMCAAAKITAGDVVLEIGPGQGSLTEQLLRHGADIIALEYDNSLIPILGAKFGDSIQLEQGDVRTYDFTSLPPEYKLVANIPYYLTSYLIQTLSETTNPPTQAVLLIQKEVAERVSAAPGSMSVLSITAQFYWQISLGDIIPAYLFIPPPKVNSQIVIMEHRQRPLYNDVKPQAFFRLVKMGFAQRRKTLLNALSSGLQLPKSEIDKLLSKTAIDPNTRSQNLSLDDWHRLYMAASHHLAT